jgi:hypothetical protein
MRTFGEPNAAVPALPELLAAARLRTVQVRTSPAAGQNSLLQLSALVEQIQSATRAAQKLVLGREPVDLTWRLERGSWSVAECFDHLAQTARAFLPAISTAAAAAPGLSTNRSLQTGTVATLFIRHLEPPYRLRYKVLHQLAPQCKDKDFEAAYNGFVESQAQLSEAICSAAGLAIDRVRIKSPVYGRISYNVYGAFRILAAHERRHLWQAEQILKALDQTPPLREQA